MRVDQRRGMAAVFTLIHSPLVGPLTWSLVAEESERRGVEVAVPILTDADGNEQPFWCQHADAVAQCLSAMAADGPLILAGHSGVDTLLDLAASLNVHMNHRQTAS